MNTQTKNRVIGVLENVTGRSLPFLNYDDDLSSQLELDSVQIVELFAGLENEFGIELPLTMMQANSANNFLEQLDQTLSKACA